MRQTALIFAWSLYDLANQFFALNIVSLYFVRWLTLEKNVPEIFYSVAFGISTFFVAVSSPVLGRIADAANKHKPFLICLTLLSVVFTMILGISENVFIALFFFTVANFGCQLAIVFYNALIMNIAPAGKIGLISGIGRVFGYSGAILALYLFKPLVLKSGYKATFFPTGLLFFIFALPCMIFVKDKTQTSSSLSYPFKDVRPARSKFILGLFRPPSPQGLSAATGGLSDFLKASFFGLCAVNTIILFMSVYATKALLLTETQILELITFSTFFAMAGSFIFGYISDFLGSKTSLITAFVLWAGGITAAALTINPTLYWIIGALVGLAFGSTWTVSRAFVVRLVPLQRMGEVFGVFNFVGYLSAITGAFFWGLILLLLAPLGQIGYRMALFSLNIFFALGIVFLLRIPETK